MTIAGEVGGIVGIGVGLYMTGMLINMTQQNVNRLIDQGKGRKVRKVKPIVTGMRKGMRMPPSGLPGRKGKRGGGRVDHNVFSAKNLSKTLRYY